ncbi:hypothetical protein JOC37_000458 [Desulfohalotomaculum tongense]|uniref:DVU0772 family protein n=1 Tax=Desulforadius tongensis TaxID=1216062 RepID=UPI00195CF732|nr:hypothetical protein [Desulforadius tongensis]MBM7854086.1 hypothetical protein [Desulforadius tongensis]
MNIEKIKSNLCWDFKFEDEFKTEKTGYTFIVDVCSGTPALALYRFTPYGCKCEPLEEQPPVDMIKRALVEQGNGELKDGFYYLDNDLRAWVENNILKV